MTVVLARRSSLPLALTAFFLALGIASSVFLLRFYHDALGRGEAFAEMQARSMEGFLAHSLDTLAIVADSLAPAADGTVSGSDLLRAMPLIRSLSFVDADGRILASTAARNIGVRVELGDFYPPGLPTGMMLIGHPWQGRDFFSGSPSDPETAGDGLGFVPVLRVTNGRQILVALNTDYFLSHFVQNLPAEKGHVDVIRYDGLLLFSSAAGARPGGSTGTGAARDDQPLDIHGTGWISHRQTASMQPLIVIASYDRAQALADWRRTALVLTVVIAASALFSIALAIVFLRRRGQIEAQQRALEHLERVNAACVFTNAREGIIICDADGSITDVNDSFVRLTGIDREAALGRPLARLQPRLDGSVSMRRMQLRLRRYGYWQGEIAFERRDGGECVALATVSVVADEAGRRRQYVTLFSDITTAKRQAQLLERAAHYDSLTSLPNRAMISRRLNAAMASATGDAAIAVAFIDIDGFKAINDQLGHAAGDSLLVVMATRLRAALRAEDSLGRIGGDEFVAILSGIGDASDGIALMQRMLDAARMPATISGEEMHVSASIGVTFYPQEQATDADQLMRQADLAMYQAKLGGKGRYHVFDADLDRTTREYHAGLERLRTALANREFVLFFQPLINIATGEITEMEALIRWQHPDGGLLAPAGFIPLIEGSPLAVDVGEWVIEEALGHLEGWLAEGLDLMVDVNTSGIHLQRHDFLDRLKRILARFSPEARQRLGIEIPEAVVFSDLDTVSATVRDGRRIGLRFLLDDFGTGYSSLAYLKRLPVDALKIDRTFIRDMQESVETTAVLKAILRIASELGIETVAEGVETVEQWASLERLGCDKAQGYLITPPMPANEVAAWCRAYAEDAGRRRAAVGA